MEEFTNDLAEIEKAMDTTDKGVTVAACSWCASLVKNVTAKELRKQGWKAYNFSLICDLCLKDLSNGF